MDHDDEEMASAPVLAEQAGAHGEALARTVGQRVRASRVDLGMTVGELAERAQLSKGMLSKIENAQVSPSMATLARLSLALSCPVTTFFRGLDEDHDALFIKAGTGQDVHHQTRPRGHRFQLLGRMRSPHDRFEPILVTLTERSESFPLYQHDGTEMLYMITGRMEYGYGGSRFLLEPGDSLQFVGSVTHGPTALLDLPIQFLAIKSTSALG